MAIGLTARQTVAGNKIYRFLAYNTTDAKFAYILVDPESESDMLASHTTTTQPCGCKRHGVIQDKRLVGVTIQDRKGLILFCAAGLVGVVFCLVSMLGRHWFEADASNSVSIGFKDGITGRIMLGLTEVQIDDTVVDREYGYLRPPLTSGVSKGMISILFLMKALKIEC